MHSNPLRGRFVDYVKYNEVVGIQWHGSFESVNFNILCMFNIPEVHCFISYVSGTEQGSVNKQNE